MNTDAGLGRETGSFKMNDDDERDQKLKALGEVQVEIRRILMELNATRERRDRLLTDLVNERVCSGSLAR